MGIIRTVVNKPLMHTRAPSALSRVGVIAAVLAATLALCACGSGSPTTTATKPSNTGTPTVTEPSVPSKQVSAPEPLSPVAGVEVIISTLQSDLQQLGYAPGSIDGQFGPGTQAALRRLQSDKGVAADEQGAIGPDTAAKLPEVNGGGAAVVSALQSALTEVGLFKSTIDGSFGPKTTEAVEALQRKLGQQPDGFYGPATAAGLQKLYRLKDPEPVKDAATESKPSPSEGSGQNGSGELLKLGSKSAAVKTLQQRLIALGYRPGTADGSFGPATASAVLAFQKRNGLTRDSVVGPTVQAALKDPKGAGPRSGPVPRIDIDIARQVIFVVLKSGSVITLNTSTGNGETYSVPGGGTDVADTPVGSFTVIRRFAGDEKAPLGTLRNPLYFYRGWAIHGAANVPAYPASHGCARISNADADWLFPQIPLGTPVIVYDTTGKSPSVGQLSGRTAPGF